MDGKYFPQIDYFFFSIYSIQATILAVDFLSEHNAKGKFIDLSFKHCCKTLLILKYSKYFKSDRKAETFHWMDPRGWNY